MGGLEGGLGFLDHVPIGMFVLGEDYVVLSWNACLAGWSGVARDDIIGKNLGAYFPQLSAPAYVGRLRGVFAGGPPVVFSSQLHKHLIPAPLAGGGLRIQHTTVTSLPAPAGGFHALFAIQDVTDLTNRIQAYRTMRDQALQEAEERRRAEETLEHRLDMERLVAAISSSFVGRGSDGVTRGINLALQAVAESTGMDCGYVFEIQPGGVMDNTHEWRAEGVEPSLEREVGLPIGRFSWWLEHLSQFEVVHMPRVADLPSEAGGEREMLRARGAQSSIVVPMIYGSLVGFLGFDSIREQKTWMDEDIALLRTVAETIVNALERKRAEEMLRQYTFELESRNEELDAFAHTVAHDLKNPLHVIRGYAEATTQAYSVLSEEEILQYLSIIGSTAKKMGDITNELLLLSTLHATEIDSVVLDMAKTVAEAQGRLAFEIEERGASVTMPEDWPEAVGYGPWVEEVWVNYVSNGLKYGGDPPCLTLGATSQDNGYVRFWVRDNGRGLDLEAQSQLFTAFKRLEQSRAEGHGLGLSIVKRIVERLGGEVGVESEGEPGCGCTFSFSLPRAASG